MPKEMPAARSQGPCRGATILDVSIRARAVLYDHGYVPAVLGANVVPDFHEFPSPDHDAAVRPGRAVAFMNKDALKAGYAGDVDARTLFSGYGVSLGCHARREAIGIGSGRNFLLEIPPTGCGNAKRLVGINEHAPAWPSQDPDTVLFHASPLLLSAAPVPQA